MYESDCIYICLVTCPTLACDITLHVNEKAQLQYTFKHHFQVPFLRTWFANNKVNKFTVSVQFKRLGEMTSPQSILNNGDCLDTAGFAISHSDETVMANITTVTAGKSGQAGQVIRWIIFILPHPMSVCENTRSQVNNRLYQNI